MRSIRDGHVTASAVFAPELGDPDLLGLKVSTPPKCPATEADHTAIVSDVFLVGFSDGLADEAVGEEVLVRRILWDRIVAGGHSINIRIRIRKWSAVGDT